MSDMQFDSEAARQEAARMQQQVATLLETLGGRDTAHIDIGTASKQAVYRQDKMTLYRYDPVVDCEVVEGQAGEQPKPAVLICYALVNRPYMMDLQPDRSLIRGLLKLGVDVFLIDWGYPDGADRFLDLNDYVNDYLRRCVERVCTLRGETQVNLLGVCQGGVLSLCFTALHPERVRSLITMVTPVDFQTPQDLLSKWVQPVDVQALVAASGNVSGDWLNTAFVSLMPFRLLSQKYMALLDIAHDPAKLDNFLRMEKWIFDSPDQPGALFEQFITCCYQQNQLIKGDLVIGGQRVELRNITQPVFNIFGTQDHLVPPAASRCLKQYVGSQTYAELAFDAGHIGIYVSGKAQREIPSAITQWLRKQHGY